MSELASNLWFIATVIAWFGTGMAWVAAWRWRRLVGRFSKQTEDAIEGLEALQRSQDPGREVHERLAAAIEPTLIGDNDGPPGTAAQLRRTAAMVVALKMIDAIQRANLELVAKEEP